MPYRGECNGCGLCCVRGEYRCENLLPDNRCAVYEDRVEGMAITLFGPDGGVSDVCHASYPHCLPDRTVLPEECSYEWVEPEKVFKMEVI